MTSTSPRGADLSASPEASDVKHRLVMSMNVGSVCKRQVVVARGALERTANLFTVTVALHAIACSADDVSEALTHQIDDAQAHVDALRAEIEDHATTARTAVDLASMRGMEPRHDEAVHDHMADLAHAMTDMSSCHGVPGDRIDAMMDMQGTCDEEHARHHDAIADAVHLEGARAEEERHRAAMMHCLDEMGSLMHEMMRDYGMAMCSGQHGQEDHNRP